jgi:N-acetylglucosaminyldiphosphoundecaprenol N-acetyl-beta-D-mannosaminyltransferase
VNRESMLGYSVVVKRRECIHDINVWVKNGDRCRWLACANPHSLAVAKGDKAFRQALMEADWLVPDGIGIVFGSRVTGGKLTERITGSDIFADVNIHLNEIGAVVFFLGSTDESLEKIRKKMARDYPNIIIGGVYSPPFKPSFTKQELDVMIDAINEVEPDVLWVGMTSPKQDLFLYKNRLRINAKFAAGIGAVFDFYTGKVNRSHPVFQMLGLEWLPRLIREPTRLWRRMFLSAPIFIWDVLVCALRKRPRSR